jgi:hypothetical protein
MNFLNANSTLVAASVGGQGSVCAAVEGAAEGDTMSLGGFGG